jgi:acylphosphatase
MAKKCLHLKIFGEVQGVGFRYYAREKAEELNLTGWIRNNFDGTVECEICGEQDSLEKFLKWANKGPSWAKVEKVEVKWNECRNDFSHFEIRY